MKGSERKPWSAALLARPMRSAPRTGSLAYAKTTKALRNSRKKSAENAENEGRDLSDVAKGVDGAELEAPEPVRS